MELRGVLFRSVNRSVDRKLVAGGVCVADADVAARKGNNVAAAPSLLKQLHYCGFNTIACVVPLSFHFDIYCVVKTADSSANALIPASYFDITSAIVRAVNL